MSLREAFETKKSKLGEVKFSKSSPTDPFCVKVAGIIAAARQVTVPDIFKEIEEQVTKVKGIAATAPTIHHTIVDNIYESELFSMFEKLNIPVEGAPQFSKITFRKLMEAIRGEHNRFFPLRNFIEKRPHANPAYYYTDDPHDPETKTSRWASIKTAAATPNGEFIFNIPFMQKLIDWAHLKQLKPKGKKYDSNGGILIGSQKIEIPWQYCYLEFLVMHEYLHYSEADFYYQNIIPDAHPKIINYVGDFRSNYLLVKSGYEQLPIGLFCDKINYDQQKAYIDMYNIVKNEMEQLPQGGGGEMELPIEVGTRVRCPNGKKGVVTAINPDGTAVVQEED
jgi:hypothetical protein